MFEACINFYVPSCSLFRVYRINVTFCDKDGEETHIKVPIGMSMLEAAHENDIELEGNLFICFTAKSDCLKVTTDNSKRFSFFICFSNLMTHERNQLNCLYHVNSIYYRRM